MNHSESRVAWCERTAATGNTWHLRPLTNTGLHLGGGIDTDSFCGRVVAPNGWDLTPTPDAASARRMAATIDHTGRQACPTCVQTAFGGDHDV